MVELKSQPKWMPSDSALQEPAVGLRPNLTHMRTETPTWRVPAGALKLALTKPQLRQAPRGAAAPVRVDAGRAPPSCPPAHSASSLFSAVLGTGVPGLRTWAHKAAASVAPGRILSRPGW